MEAGRFAAGSSRTLRLDPFSLPVRFEAADEAADGRRRVIDLHRERVVVRRSVRGMRMALNLPVAAFRGVAIRLTGAVNGPPTSIAVVLEHGDPALSLPLFSSSTVTTSWPNGSLGVACLVCRSSSLSLTAVCANRSHVLARCASKPRPGAAAGAAPSHAGGLRSCCGVAPGCRQRRPPCIAASARSSHRIECGVPCFQDDLRRRLQLFNETRRGDRHYSAPTCFEKNLRLAVGDRSAARDLSPADAPCRAPRQGPGYLIIISSALRKPRPVFRYLWYGFCRYSDVVRRLSGLSAD